MPALGAAMRTYGLDDFPDDLRGAAVVVGNFDGVHRGHAWVLQVAGNYGLPVVVLTFEPHPRAVLLPNAAPFRLTPARAKAEALAKAGADAMVSLAFDAALAAESAEGFAERVLADALAASIVVIGHDYQFGKDREGDAALLGRIGEARGFRLVSASPAKNAWGERYSSSRIRDRILSGDMTEAQRLLGRPWAVSGEARALADGRLALPLGDYLRPQPGRYAVTLRNHASRPAHGTAALAEGENRLIIEGAEGEGPLTVFLHQRLGPADLTTSPREGAARGPDIFYAAE